ncbi:MAG: CinA family protein [Anaerolineae bacterium]
MREAYAIGPLLKARGWRIAVAESCSGGLLGHEITTVSGSSAYFLGGVIAYADEIKIALLGVSETSLRRWGAVSAAVALEMAAGVRRRTGAEVGLSITGIAGPTGGTPQKPVGLTYIGLAAPRERRVWRHVWNGERNANKQASAQAALAHLLRYLR